MCVSRTTVGRFNSVLNKASKSVIGKLKNGEISISTAYDTVKNTPVKIIQPKVKVKKNYRN